MNRIKTTEVSISAVIALIFFLAFNYTYPYHLMYTEDRSWFLTTWNYAQEILSQPAGVACYIGSFLSQILYYPTIGAIMIAVLLFVCERLTVKASKAPSSVWTPLCWLPMVMMTRFILHTRSTLTPLAAIIICLSIINLAQLFKNWKARALLLALLLPFASYAVGITATMLPLFIIGDILCQRERWTRKTVCIIAAIIYTQGIIYWLAFIGNMPVASIICGPFYTTANSGFDESNSIVMAIIITMFIARRMRWPSKEISRHCAAIGAIACIPIAYYTIIDHQTTKDDESLIRMHIIGSRGKWNDVKEFAKEHRPEDGNSMNYYNLALARDGKMLDNLIRNTGELGLTNLLPEIQAPQYIAKIFSCKLYYELQIYNQVYLGAVEAQNLLVGKNLCSPTIAYLLGKVSAECGDSVNARKYSTLLSNTLFHKDLGREINEILNHSERKRQIEDQNISSLTGTDYVSKNDIPNELSISEIHQIFSISSKSEAGYQYLLAVDLFTGDFENIQRDIEKCPFSNLKKARIIQEAYSFCLLKDETDGTECPEWVDEEIFRQAQTYVSNRRLGVSHAELMSKFNGTYFALIEKNTRQ